MDAREYVAKARWQKLVSEYAASPVVLELGFVDEPAIKWQTVDIHRLEKFMASPGN